MVGPICNERTWLSPEKETLARTFTIAPGLRLAGEESEDEGESEGDLTGVAMALDVPYYSQMDSRWSADFTVTKDDGTIHNRGCLVTCMAMVLAYHKCEYTPKSPIDPGTLYEFLVAKKGISAASKELNDSGIVYQFGGPGYRRHKGFPRDEESLKKQIEGELLAGRPSIACVHHHGQEHHVVIVGLMSSGEHLMNDPGRNTAAPPTAAKPGKTSQKGFGADPGMSLSSPSPDVILERASGKKEGGQGYTLLYIDTVEQV